MRRNRMVIAVIALLIAMGCTDTRSQRDTGLAPDFTLEDMGGKSVKLSDLRGKVVLLEFWATWCPPCRASIPGLVKLHTDYKDKGLVILAVSVDQGGWDGVREFIKEYGINYPVLKGNDTVSDQYQVRSIPMTLVLNKEGKISKRYIGMSLDDEIEKVIKSSL